MKLWSTIMFTAIIAGGTLLLATSPIRADDRPNFVFIIADDVSADDLPVYGHPTVQTPNLERLASEGRVFDRAYLTCSSCSPTRCSIITGRYPHNTGAPELHVPLPAGQFMFPQALREAGYYTVLAGKNHMGDEVNVAFDKVTPPRGPGGERDWVRRLAERPQEKPFFMWFASNDAHRDWQFSDRAPRYKPADMRVPPYMVDGQVTRQDLADHAHEVSRLDAFVGDVIEELERQGVAEDTYVLFTADNGRPFPRCKTRLYDSGTKTPFIVSRPGTIAPARTDSMISTIDLAATVLELAGVPIDERVQGVSFARILADPDAATRDYAFAEHNWHVGQAHERSVRHGNWLYIRNNFPEIQNICMEAGPAFPAGKELWDAHEAGKINADQQDIFLVPRPADELYNVEDDPDQLHNLASDPAHAETLKELQSKLAEWTEQTGDSVPANPSPTVSLLGGGQHLKPEFKRGPMPGEDRGAAAITARGPVQR